MSTPDTSALSAIETALKNYPGATITGGQLATLIRAEAPGLDLRALAGIPKGPGAVTAFVTQHLSGLVERIGNKGGDVLYRIDGREVVDMPPPAAEVWRTFVSPSSPNHIVFSRATGRLASRNTPAAGSDEFGVDKASLTEHDEIRAGFVDTLPEAEAAILRERVAPETTFMSWMSALREHLPEAAGKWGRYRRHKLSELLAAHIRGLGLDEPLQRAALAQARDAERSAYEQSKSQQTTVGKPADTLPAAQDDATAHARRLAHAAVDLLAYDELRALKMPLGVLLDAIRSGQ